MQNIFQKKDEHDDDFFHSLKSVCDGLLYISEADAPVMPFVGERVDAITVENILHQAGLPSDMPIEEKEFDDLFERLTSMKDWFRDLETERAKKYLELKKLLEDNLRDLKVFRFGFRRIDIYILGIDKNGNLVGVTTTAVET